MLLVKLQYVEWIHHFTHYTDLSIISVFALFALEIHNLFFIYVYKIVQHYLYCSIDLICIANNLFFNSHIVLNFLTLVM